MTDAPTIIRTGPVPITAVPPVMTLVDQLANCRPMAVGVVREKINHVIRAMRPHAGLPNIVVRNAVEASAEVSPTTAQQIIHLARGAGYIENIGTGRRQIWRLTPRGLTSHQELHP